MTTKSLSHLLEKAQRENWEALWLESKNIRHVPLEIFSLTNLINLSVTTNDRYTPDGTVHLITDNKEVLPTNLEKDKYIIHEIDVFPATLPKELGQITMLRALVICNIPAKEISIEGFYKNISKLKNLKKLLTKGVAFIEFPKGITQLSQLEDLSILDSSINELPSEIQLLKNLTSLDIENSLLRSLPKEIQLLDNLRFIGLEGSLLNIPPEILKAGDAAAVFKAYFEQRRAIGEAKLILVGQGSVGKTSLIKRIVENNFNEKETKTEGIEIYKWKVRSSVGKKISLNIWDFGGQEIMHATHQFFLTKRTLYVLVLDSRISQEENRLEYWLMIIQSFGGTAPIILVGNKIDQQPLDIDKTGLQKKYPQIKAILETSCADGRGIDDLRATIATEIAQLPHINDELPEKWFNIKDKLAERDDNYLPYKKYLEICNQHDVKDETSQRTLIGFLHDLGTMLHFQDDLRLSELGVLNPQWVTNGVYKILNSHTLFHNKGILQLKDLSEILPADEYPRNRHGFIIDMMEKFELCYAFDGKRDQYLIPDLLSKSEPDTGDWGGALEFQFHYPVLPSSIISRFIVRMNPFISKNTVWRAGVVLNLEGSRALVKADTEDRRIYISVQNGNPRLALSAIRNQLKSIHKTISGLEASEKVPVPGHPEIPPLDYEHLVTLENLSEETYIPEGLGERINVRDLLNGLQANAPQNSDIFISYSHKDKIFVKKLVENLAKDGNKIWWDFDALKGGDDWQKEIERGISQSKYFLVVLTPDSMNSEWVANEIAYAQSKGKRIIPLRLKECDAPIGLIRKQYVDFTNQTHIAATEELLGIL